MFVMDGKKYSFDGRGDLDTGYDVILWRQTSPDYLDMRYTVAQYSIEDKKLIFTSRDARNLVLDETVRTIFLLLLSYFHPLSNICHCFISVYSHSLLSVFVCVKVKLTSFV